MLFNYILKHEKNWKVYWVTEAEQFLYFLLTFFINISIETDFFVFAKKFCKYYFIVGKKEWHWVQICHIFKQIIVNNFHSFFAKSSIYIGHCCYWFPNEMYWTNSSRENGTLFSGCILVSLWLKPRINCKFQFTSFISKKCCIVNFLNTEKTWFRKEVWKSNSSKIYILLRPSVRSYDGRENYWFSWIII